MGESRLPRLLWPAGLPVAVPWLDRAVAWIMSGYGFLLLLAVPFIVLELRAAAGDVDTAHDRAAQAGASFPVDAVANAKSDLVNLAQFQLAYTVAAAVLFGAVGIWMWLRAGSAARLSAALVAVVFGLACCCGAGLYDYISSDGDTTSRLLGYGSKDTFAEVVPGVWMLTPVVSFAVLMLLAARSSMRAK